MNKTYINTVSVLLLGNFEVTLKSMRNSLISNSTNWSTGKVVAYLKAQSKAAYAIAVKEFGEQEGSAWAMVRNLEGKWVWGNYLTPNNVRLIGTYRSDEEAKFISNKVSKSVRLSEANKPTDFITQSVYNLTPQTVTPRTTNGTSNIEHHLRELADSRAERLEYQVLGSLEKDLTVTFLDWVKGQEAA